MKYKFKYGSQKMSINDTEIFINSPRFWINKDTLVDIIVEDSISNDTCRVQIVSTDVTGTMTVDRSDIAKLHEVINYFKPLMDKNKPAYEQAQKVKFRHEMIDEGAHLNNYQFCVYYLGGHPLFSNESKAVIEINEDNVKLYFYDEIFELKYQDIENVSVKTQEEVLRRMTATRYVLFGVFALAMKKKEVNRTNYIIIECNKFLLSFTENTEVLKALYNAFEAYNTKHHIIAKIDVSEDLKNLELIKKLKELLDIDAITKEEYEAKKKQLLGLG